MAHEVLTNSKLYLAGYDFSGDMNNIDLQYSSDFKDNTTFGNTAKRKLNGIVNSTCRATGYVDLGATDEAAAVAQDKVMFDKVTFADQLLVAVPQTGADGEVAFFTKAMIAEYTSKLAHGEVYAFELNAEGHERLIRGTIMTTGAKTNTGQGTARQLGAVLAGQKAYAGLLVLSASADDTIDVVVESGDSVDMEEPTTRIAFAQANAIGAQWLTADGAIADAWWRVRWTIAGEEPSFNIVVVVGIGNK